MLPSASNIQAFVQWSEQTVFAGEDIECRITFKNVAVVNSAPKILPPSPSTNGIRLGGETGRKPTSAQISATQQKNHTSQTTQNIGYSRGHRSAHSLNVPRGSGRVQQGLGIGQSLQTEGGTDGRSHRRSVSIISLGVPENTVQEAVSQQGVSEAPRRPTRGHARASSLQIVPRRPGTHSTGPLPAHFPPRSTTQPSPLFRTTSSSEDKILPGNFSLSPNSNAPKQALGTVAVPSTPGARRILATRRRDSASFPQNFKFPAAATSISDQRSAENNIRDDGYVTPAGAQVLHRLLSPRPKDEVPTVRDQVGSFTRILSPSMNPETPRSSGEFYSLSNNSTETLASEYVPQQQSRTQHQAIHIRRISNIAAINLQRAPETLMMGYAQIHGSFTLDGSLIHQATFEEVKKKGALGGQGGGVIGVDTSKRDGSLFRSFGWGNIGDSISGLIGGGELSSIKDMRGIASLKSVPLLTTPQSILFVDLRLAPGESKTYQYTFKLPRGLPPSHRGKAIKISYNLVIGTQRPGGAKEQQVRSVEVPFRVLGSVNEHGELLGHDLMSPYIILRDQAQIRVLESTTSISVTGSQKSKLDEKIEASKSSMEDFLTYVDNLLARPRQNSGLGLLSPTETHQFRRPSFIAEPSSVKDAIDLAILRSNLATDSQQSANRFEISRNGRRVAVVMLARPAYRLGEIITAAIDFTGAEIPCYALHASLETSEKIQSAIALRSEASVQRVTRKIYSSFSESTLFARRMIFSPNIPTSATPSFITSGVSLEWKILMEFVTPKFDDDGEYSMLHGTDLLEEVSRDDRGVIIAAVEDIGCESFEITVPLRVYGASVGSIEQEDEPLGVMV